MLGRFHRRPPESPAENPEGAAGGHRRGRLPRRGRSGHRSAGSLRAPRGGGHPTDEWIIVEVNSRFVALVVDAVTEVFGTGGQELRPVPSLGGGDDVRGISGVTSHLGTLLRARHARFGELTEPLVASGALKSSISLPSRCRARRHPGLAERQCTVTAVDGGADPKLLGGRRARDAKARGPAARAAPRVRGRGRSPASAWGSRLARPERGGVGRVVDRPPRLGSGRAAYRAGGQGESGSEMRPSRR